MSIRYSAISWNAQKKSYDLALGTGIVIYLGVFAGIGALVHPNATAETLLIRGLGTCALLLLHIVLCIGPLCRLDKRCLPLLYNRRHMGVTTFVLALSHGVFSLIQFHALGDISPLHSLFLSNTRFASVANFPFQIAGFGALAILFLMAATSHDFWLHHLTARVWKRLHMAVYAAYAFLIVHVATGALQSEWSPVLAGVVAFGMATVITLHIASAIVERRADRVLVRAASEGFVTVCPVDEIPEKRARVITLGSDRVAVFRYDGRVSAIANECRHQGGPLGEGKIIDGCVTCPWHGYQYLPDSGSSPPPFHEKVATYRTRVAGGLVLIHPQPQPPGTRLEPAVCERRAMGELA